MEDDHHHMSRPIINKFVIRQSIKELQSTRVFETLEALSEAVVEDLFDDGFALGPEEKADSPQSATLPTAPSEPEKTTARQNTRNASGRQTASSDRMENSIKPSAPSVASAPAVPARVLANQQLDSKNEVLRLAGQSDSVSRALLKAYAEAGDPQARRYLDEQTPSGSPSPKTR